jgi:N-sulfoglucosamine sulfohydrolase
MKTRILAALGWLAIGVAPLAAEKPNLLIITADDLNGDSMGWMGSPVGATPNLDRFAATCRRFEHFYVTAPICQPSREAFMTGRVPHRSGALGFNPIRPDVPTLPEVLRSNGWFVAAINKTGHMRPAEKFPWHLELGGSGKSPQKIREQFAQCLQAAAAAKKPFFVNANITDPHRPFPGADGARKRRDGDAPPAKIYSPDEIVVPPILEDLPDVRKEIAQYFTAVRRMDDSFAGLLAALQAAGQDTNTLIVFFSDNGISAPYSKATLFKCGAWSPMLFRRPGREQPAVDRDNLVGAVDLMPTVLELLGVAAPPGMDGRSFVPLLKGQPQAGRDHVFTWVNTVSSGKSFPGRCVRTKSRAYIWNTWPDGRTQFKVEGMSGLTFRALQAAGDTDPRIKARVDHYLFRCAEEFYDLENDPAERRNLIGEPACAGEIRRLKAMLLAEMKRTKDPLLGQFERTFAGGAKSSPALRYLEPDNAIGASQAVIVDDNAALAHTAQTLPLNRRGRVVGPNNAARQAEQVLQNLDTALKVAGSDLTKAVKLNVYLAQADARPKVQEILAARFTADSKPAVSFVVGALPEPDALIAMDAVAVVSEEKNADQAVGVRAPAGYGADGIAPVAVLPAGPKIYVSGMADTNALPFATRKTLEKLLAAIGHLGLQREDVVQLKAFLQPMSEVAAVRREIVRFFDGHAPPVVLVEWISPPPNPPIEIELIAAAKGDFSKESDPVSFLTPPGTTDSKVFKRVTRVNHGRQIYVSGLYGLKSSDGAGQLREIFADLGAVLKKTGSDFEHLAKATYYVTDADASDQLNKIRLEFYNPQRPPAASKATVKAVGCPGKTVTLDMIAVTR